MSDPYENRPLTEGYPNLDQLAVEYFAETQERRENDAPRIANIVTLISRLIALPPDASMCVVGCGPVPHILKILRDRGFRAVGVEPIPGFVRKAREFLGDPQGVQQAAAECLPLADKSIDVVFLENVLEHVESPFKSLNEAFRVVRPGGIAYVTTTNRQRISLVGENGEFRVPFFNRLPKLVQESYVFAHLHYRPHLANFTRRPAVHWFSFSSLCAMGRQAGFAEFYSPLDLRRKSDVPLNASPLRRSLHALGLLPLIQRNPWLRALALTQLGADIIMWRRSDP